MSKKTVMQRQDSNNLPENPVKRIRKRLGLEQEAFAEMLGVSDKYVSMLETERRPVSHKIALKIMDIAPPGTRIEWLLGQDRFETEEEEWEYQRQQSQRAGVMEEELFKRIARHAGYSLERKSLSLKELASGKENYVFKDDTGVEICLGFFGNDGIQELWSDFFDYAAFRLKRTIERKKKKSSVIVNLGNTEKENDNG